MFLQLLAGTALETFFQLIKLYFLKSIYSFEQKYIFQSHIAFEWKSSLLTYSKYFILVTCKGLIKKARSNFFILFNRKPQQNLHSFIGKQNLA